MTRAERRTIGFRGGTQSACVALLAATMVSSLTACGPKTSARQQAEVDLEQYGHLPGLKATHLEPLRDELARIEAERATPLQLDEARGFSSQPSMSDPAQDAAARLGVLFKNRRELTQADDHAAVLMPSGPFEFAPVRLQEAIVFRRRHDKRRQEYEAALHLPSCRFGYRHVRGPGADTSFVMVARVGNRLEAFQIAEQLRDGRPDVALGPLAVMLRMTELLAAENNVTVRLWAARLREEALQVAAAVIQHRAATRETADEIRAHLEGLRLRWPADAGPWIGDRALGMHIYEMLRDGQLLNVLTYEEIDQLRADATLGVLGQAIQDNIDVDELFYLRTMRHVIELCDEPYFSRRDWLIDLKRRMSRLAGGPDDPLIAARILLPEIELGHRTQAHDLALCEMWLVALSHSLGRDYSAWRTSPLSGQAYEVSEEETRIIVRDPGLPDDSPEVIVPRFAAPR